MTATATAAKITYRKTGKGEWVAFGPASAIKPGAQVAITKANSPVQDCRWVKSVGRTFTVDGVEMVYGYLMPDAGRPASRTAPARTAASKPRARMCDECGERRAVTTAVDLSGIAGDVCGTCARSGALSFA